MSAKTVLFNQICQVCHEQGFPKPTAEVRFDELRRWRFDVAWPNKIALEIQGGTWTRGKHGRGSGIAKDHEKLNAAQLQGWIVLQLAPKQVKSGEWIPLLLLALDFRCRQELEWCPDTRVSIPKEDLQTVRIDNPESEMTTF